MRCDNCYCVYYEKGGCVLDSISLDRLGLCTDCIYVDVDEKVLQLARKRFRNRNGPVDE